MISLLIAAFLVLAPVVVAQGWRRAALVLLLAIALVGGFAAIIAFDRWREGR